MIETTQERWDRVFRLHDRTCPPQRADESEMNYMRRLSRIGRKYIPRYEEIGRVKFDSSLPDEVVPKLSEMMRDAVERNVYRVDNMQPGEIREVIKTDPRNGQKTHLFIGPDSFVKAMGLPARRARILAPPQQVLAGDGAARRAMAGTW
jgi:hypothetical protein